MRAADQFSFVLFKPQSAGNVGAAARALKNMGFGDLRLVAPDAMNRRESATMAVHADDVLETATTYRDLAAAIADASITVGTTCRPGLYRAGAVALREAARELMALAKNNRVAIIFGPEDHGLSNRELKLCHRLITIPTAPEYPSLNLSQAVIVVAYELRMALHEKQPRAAAPKLVAAAEGDAMLERMAQALIAVGFLPADNPEHIMFAIRAMLGRSGITRRELEILNGIASHVRWAAEGGAETLERKRRAGRKLK